jgi:hypothetical protein
VERSGGLSTGARRPYIKDATEKAALVGERHDPELVAGRRPRQTSIDELERVLPHLGRVSPSLLGGRVDRGQPGRSAGAGERCGMIVAIYSDQRRGVRMCVWQNHQDSSRFDGGKRCG